MTAGTWTTSCCGQKYTGSNTAHCTSCHHGFTGPSAFDRHMTLDGCKNPAKSGLVLDRRGLWGWPRSSRMTGFLKRKRQAPA